MKRLEMILVWISILCTLQAAYAQNVEFVSSSLWGGDNDVKVVGEYAYCAFAMGLVVLDISNPDSPAFVSQLFIPGIGESIDVEGDYAYMAEGSSGLQIVNISDPYSPSLAGSYNMPGRALDVFVSGDHAYVAEPDSGLQVIDVSNPENPVFAGRYYSWGNNVWSVFISGDYAYAASGSDRPRLLIIDVSDPTDPSLAAEVETYYPGGHVCVSGGYAYVSEWYWSWSHFDGNIEVFDVSDPLNPSFVVRYGTTGYSDLHVASDYAFATFVGDDGSGLEIIDVSEPGNPIMIGRYDDQAYSVALSVLGNYAYIVGYGFEVIDISDFENPVGEGRYATYISNGAWVSGDYAYVVGSTGGPQIVNVTDPYNPTLAGNCDTSRAAINVFISGQFAYLAGGDLQIADVSDPYNVVLAASYETPNNAVDVFVSGDYAYVSERNTGLQIVNVTDPFNPAFAGSINTLGPADGVFVSGAFAYVASGHFEVLEISNPADPVRAGSCDMPGNPNDVFVSGQYAYVADGDLEIVDISLPTNPVLVTSYDAPGANSVFISGRYVYVVGSDLRILNISEPANPVFEASYDIPRNARGVCVQGDYIYVADTYSLLILRFNPQTGIEEVESLPRQLALIQNYPNPFNASTSISYCLPQAGDIAIDIYDLLGRKVQELFKAKQAAGQHRVLWNAGDLASGIYFARLRAGSHSDVIRMTLLK